MQITDVIADMLTRIRNAGTAKQETVDVPASNVKSAIARILAEEGYVKEVQTIDDGKQGVIRLYLKYTDSKRPVISGIKRISKPVCACTRQKTNCRRCWVVSALQLFRLQAAL